MARDPFFLAWREPRRWHCESMTATLEALRRGASPLLAVTTGAGKTDWTCHAAWLAAVESGGYHGAVILVPTEALVEQTYEALVRRATVDGTRAPLFTSGRWYGRRKEAGADVVVCCYPSLPTLVAEWAVTDRRPHLLIVDEAHGSEAETVRAAVAALGPRRMVGLTATPYRSGAGERLGLFSEVAGPRRGRAVHGRLRRGLRRRRGQQRRRRGVARPQPPGALCAPHRRHHEPEHL